MTEKKKLSERQQVFVDAIMGEAAGDIRAAMDIAGYSKNTTIKEAVEPVKDEIVEAIAISLRRLYRYTDGKFTFSYMSCKCRLIY